ncbi:MAG: ATP synthase subunit I [Chrysiogenales bacterium]|nr:MAG: ATP synthase subunit I [Chrysiogenales bacterium]
MTIQQRLIRFVTRANWVLFVLFSVAGFMLFSRTFAMGVVAGGIIVTVNFHLLSKTLRGALTPPYLASHNAVLAKYYMRFSVSGLIIIGLIWKQIVNPIGLSIGLSVVVASIMLATIVECKNLIFKEAV